MQGQWQVFYHAHALLLTFTPVYGLYRFYSQRSQKLYIGIHFTVVVIYFISFFIADLYAGKSQTPLYLASSLCLLWLFLLLQKQWDQLLYQNIAIINYAYYIRLNNARSIETFCWLAVVALMVEPLYSLYCCVRQRDVGYLSRWVISIGICDSLLFGIYHLSQFRVELAYAAVIKVVIMMASIKMYIHYQDQQSSSVQKLAV